MSESRYPYTVTPEEMSKTSNTNMVDHITTKGVTCKASGHEHPLRDLFQDSEVVIINGGVKELQDAKKDENYEDFEIHMKKEFSTQNYNNLTKLYSQTPMYFLGSYLHSGCITGEALNDPLIFRTPTRECHLYQDKDGEVYFHTQADNYPIAEKDEPNIIIGHLKGHIEAVFKLTDNGFELQEIKTDSELLQDMCLGKPITKDRIMQNTFNNIVILKKLEGTVVDLIANEKKLRELPKKKMTTNLELELASARGVLRAVKDYKNQKIDLDDLQEAVAGYQKQAAYANTRLKNLVRFFSRTPPKATHELLNNLSLQIKSLNVKPTITLESKRI